MNFWANEIIESLSPASIWNELSVYFYFDSIWHLLQTVLDILIVAYVIYKLIVLLRDTRAWQLLKGVVFILVATKITGWFGFKTIKFLLDNTIQYIALAFIIIFQPELRRALEKLGTSSISSIMTGEGSDEILVSTVIEAIVSAADSMSRTRTGALIVIEGKTKLGDIMDECTEVDSKVSAGLLLNIFEPNTPLHDGAVIVRDNRIKAAACYLPHSRSTMIPKELGTRHRAAIGVSEVSDAMAIVVSEETGHISIAQGGNLQRGLTPELLRAKLQRQLDIANAVEESDENERILWGFIKLEKKKKSKTKSSNDDNVNV